MTKWEYKVEINLGDERGDMDQQAALNELGQQGWELLAVTSVFVPAKSGHFGGRRVKLSGGSNIGYFFKRPA